ncbi:TetR/AcrR family transcriptional regulator [Streptomonospora sp. S1-112]|uniref:TetR/AcrR family transcriptional regulator n=1 Tax=Streptomonospora mangrovi TaxID=2883123 RepID=A0A9X3SQ24_9ACTN|nr:TetR/AcrR family transcriptional regulator [Streptomonospora mangrovi]MDA0566306.1 TetR/AcrR family transcriptional regulator [Streptomonospora mangrovi]
MSERRRSLMRLEIARAAVKLFRAKGVAATTGDDIAGAIGISARTLWRYFPTKESCVRPLLTGSLETLAAALRDCPPGAGLLAHLERVGIFADRETLGTEPIADLVRMTRTEPALRTVWLDVHHAAEEVFAEIIAERVGAAPGDLAVRMQAAVLNAALRVAAEEHARALAQSSDPPPLGAVLRTALTAAAPALPAFAPAPEPDTRPRTDAGTGT